MAHPSRPSHLPLDDDQPGHWLAATSLLDLEHPKLRLRVRALTQLSKGEREKALAVYGFVKRMPLARRIKLRHRPAHAVIQAGRGDSSEKATLLVAMLRAAGIPARMRYLEFRGEILRGLTSRVRQPVRPLLEMWLHGRWLRTDTFIFDAAYMAAARQRLKEQGWEWGYGINVGGAMLWDGWDNAFVGGRPIQDDPMVVADLGAYHDPQDFSGSRAFREHRPPLARMLQWNVLSPLMQRGIRRLRDERSP